MEENKQGFQEGMELVDYKLKQYPMLMIDRITELVPGERARGYKNVSNNEWFFEGHFRGNPIMPGTIQLESLFQLAQLAILGQNGPEGSRITVLNHRMKLKREITPGDRMELEVAVNRKVGSEGIWEAAGTCTTEKGLAFSASFLLKVIVNE